MWRRISVLAAIAIVAGCSGPSPQDQIDTAERASLAPLKNHYPDVIMGFDFHGPVVDISVDVNQMVAMEETDETAMEAEAVKDWRQSWIAAHPHQHAKLTVRILDFRGHTQFTGTTSA